MEKYRKVRTKREDDSPEENEVRVTNKVKRGTKDDAFVEEALAMFEVSLFVML